MDYDMHSTEVHPKCRRKCRRRVIPSEGRSAKISFLLKSVQWFMHPFIQPFMCVFKWYIGDCQHWLAEKLLHIYGVKINWDWNCV